MRFYQAYSSEVVKLAFKIAKIKSESSKTLQQRKRNLAFLKLKIG